jgi:deoxyribodipyrimidine photo-lyase
MDPARLRALNPRPLRASGDYVLYWMQATRRLQRNHALDYALEVAATRGCPVVVYEGLRLGYPWASPRIHRFVLEGMRANREEARRMGLNYWPFVETPEQSGRGLLRRLAERAVLVVTDDYPAFIVPGQAAALATRSDVAVMSVDSSAVVPLARLGVAPGAAHLRLRLHRLLPSSWPERAQTWPLTAGRSRPVDPPFEPWDGRIDELLSRLAFLRPVPPVDGVEGGRPAGLARLAAFVRDGLRGYAARRSRPAPPEKGHASGLSPYLHFGHLSVEEVFEAVAGVDPEWDPALAGRRDEFFGPDPDVNAFLDEALVWRTLGYAWMRERREDTLSLDRALPAWARQTLEAHGSDPRPHLYSPDQLEAADTHDPLWNAAQRELVATGTIHNYLRMLWGKKVLEWSRTPAQAYATLVDLNNTYALDGRDPNSWSGILWCFGLFDRPWPERAVFGRVRSMSSANTARKFALGPYLAYVDGLARAPEAVRPGRRAPEPGTGRTPCCPW